MRRQNKFLLLRNVKVYTWMLISLVHFIPLISLMNTACVFEFSGVVDSTQWPLMNWLSRLRRLRPAYESVVVSSVIFAFRLHHRLVASTAWCWAGASWQLHTYSKCSFDKSHSFHQISQKRGTPPHSYDEKISNTSTTYSYFLLLKNIEYCWGKNM